MIQQTSRKPFVPRHQRSDSRKMQGARRARRHARTQIPIIRSSGIGISAITDRLSIRRETSALANRIRGCKSIEEAIGNTSANETNKIIGAGITLANEQKRKPSRPTSLELGLRHADFFDSLGIVPRDLIHHVEQRRFLDLATSLHSARSLRAAIQLATCDREIEVLVDAMAEASREPEFV